MDDVDRYSHSNYGDFVLKGRGLLGNAHTKIAESTWIHHSDLRFFGWTCVQAAPSMSNDRSIRIALHDLGLVNTASQAVKFVWTHSHFSQPVESGAGVYYYYPTMGTYSITCHPHAIIATNSYGPDANGSEQKPPITGSHVVPLKHWSDIAFLQWQEYWRSNPARLSNLRVILQTDITNKTTERIAEEALRSEGRGLCEWGAGETYFSVHTEQAKALLATPVGSGVAYLLYQHKQNLRSLALKGVTVFGRWSYAGLPALRLNLCWHIEPRSPSRRAAVLST